MTGARRSAIEEAITDQIRALAAPLVTAEDLTALVERASGARFVGIGEASHGTGDFYRWRAALSRRLIEERGFRWIGVEGDWPDCWRINRWVRGLDNQDLDVRGLLVLFERWPTWLWANEEVADFLGWLHEWNLARPADDRVGFYGLDVYSLWDSLREIIGWLETNVPEAVADAMQAWRCFLPYGEDPQQYAWGTRLVPASCEAAVVALLAQVRVTTEGRPADDEAVFDVRQNAEVAANAEHYYRVMVRGDRESWNIRDRHMADTIDRVAAHLGPESKGLIWEHNTHIGDARATDMAIDGIVNVGQLIRERHGENEVVLVGFASHRGDVLAALDWGKPESVMTVPAARVGSHEDILHRALGRPAVLVFGDDRSGVWLNAWLNHRAIGVVYQPAHEVGNYVPTRMGARYDALIWCEESAAVRPLRHEPRPEEHEFETEPTGF